MLSRRVDLTADRDFGPPSLANFENWRWDAFAHAYNMEARSQIHIEYNDSKGEHVVIHRFYPWNIFLIESEDYMEESPHFSDPISNEVGFDVYGDLDRPFLMGNYSDRNVRKFILEDCYGLRHCERCGEKLNVFDEAHSKYYGVCKRCSTEHEFDRMKEQMFEVPIAATIEL